MDYNNTNFWDVLVIALICTFYLSAFAGTAYLISKDGWSPWWMLFTLFVLSIIKFKTGGPQ